MNDKVQGGLLIAGIIGLCGVLFAIFHFGIKFLDRFATYLKGIFFASTWTLSPLWIALEISAGLGLLCYLIYRLTYSNYSLDGYQASSTHIWVEPKTRRKISSASEKDVYEHLHGAGSWGNKEFSIKKSFVYIGGCFAFFLPLVMMLIHKSYSHLALAGALVGLSFFVIAAILYQLYDAAIFNQETAKECLHESIFILLMAIAVFAVLPIISAMICFFHHQPLPNWSVKLQLWCHFIFFIFSIFFLIGVPVSWLFKFWRGDFK